MAIFLRGSAAASVILGLGIAGFGAEGPVKLRERARQGETTRVLIALNAEGLFLPGPPPTGRRAEPSKPLKMRAERRLEFAERIVKLDADGRARRAVRRAFDAASAINGEVRPFAASLRPEVAVLVAEPRAHAVVVFSPSGPLTRSELELVQGEGDPLVLPSLLPSRAVKVGDRWRVGDEAARAVSAYDTLADNALEAVLEALDDDSAHVHLSGAVRGSALGGDGTMTCDGSFVFDRAANRIERLTVSRVESRKPGPVEAGLEVKSTLTVTRRAAEPPPELSDSALAALPATYDPQIEQLLLVPPSGKYDLRHDRDWHTYWQDTRLTVLKRLDDRGLVVAQCNLAIGPNAGKGRHQDLEQFRGDLRRALGRRFGEIVGEGEVEGDAAGGFRYKVGVQGREGDLGVFWYYYLVASTEGEQLLAMFTLSEDQAKPFGDQDLQMIGSLRWREPDAGAKP